MEDASDKESVRTEDFITRFEEINEPADVDEQSARQTTVDRKNGSPLNKAKSNSISSFRHGYSESESKYRTSMESPCFLKKQSEFERLRETYQVTNTIASSTANKTVPVTMKGFDRTHTVQLTNPTECHRVAQAIPANSNRWASAGRLHVDASASTTPVRSIPASQLSHNPDTESGDIHNRWNFKQPGTNKQPHVLPQRRILPTSWRGSSFARAPVDTKIQLVAGNGTKMTQSARLCVDELNKTPKNGSAKHWEVPGLSEDEVNAVVAERDELYEILRMNEDADSARFASTQALINFKQDAFAEQQRLRQRIVALEEELEESLCRLNQMSNEQNTLKESLSRTQADRDSLEHQLQSTQHRFTKEMQSLKEEFAEREKQHLEEQRRQMDSLQKLGSHHATKENEANREIASLRDEICNLKIERDSFRLENSNMALQQTEKEKIALENFETTLRQKLLEKDAEILQLNGMHSHQISELSKKWSEDKEDAMNNVRVSYLKTIEELQTMISLKDNEYQECRVKLTQADKQLQELLGRESIECSLQQMCDTLLDKFREMQMQTAHACHKPIENVVEQTDDRLVDMLREELQQERERARTREEEMNQMRTNFEEYRMECERKLMTCTLDMERLKMSYEAELLKLQHSTDENLSRVKTEHNVGLSLAVDEMRQSLMAQHENELRSERQTVNEAFENALHLTTNLLNNVVQECSKLLNDWSTRLCSDEACNIALDEKTAISSKDSCRLDEGSTDAVQNPTVKAFLAQLTLLTREKSRQLWLAVSQAITAGQDHVDQVKQSTERERMKAERFVRQVEDKAQLELEKAEQRHILEYQQKIQQLTDKSIETQLLTQLQQKEEQLVHLRSQMESLERDMEDKLKASLRLEYEKQWEEKLQELTKTHLNIDCTSGPAATRVVMELKNRIQRLREENLSLRRLLLRRQPVKGFTCTQALEETKQSGKLTA